MFDMHDGWGWWMLVGWIWMVIFWGLIVWGVYAIVSRLGGNRRIDSPSNAMSILEERYARGEINREQFEEMRQTIQR